jgi:hypothetical protein
LAGLPTTSTLTSGFATSASARPWAVKMAPFASRRSFRSIPLVRGRLPTKKAMSAPSKAVVASSVWTMPASSGNAQSDSSMATPPRAGSAGVISRRRSTMGRSRPSAPLASRKTRLYPIWPAAPVTVIWIGSGMAGR